MPKAKPDPASAPPDPPPHKSGITEDMAAKILDADFKNIVKKVAAGKPLTVAERTRIEAQAAGSSDSTAYAKNKVELAGLLGISRRTLDNWRKSPGAPEPLSNGTYPVAEWREFARTKGKHGGTATDPAHINEAALKARKLLAEVEERELRVAIKRGQYVLIETVRREWIGHVAQATGILRAKFENELPPILSGLDATGIQNECRKAIDEVLRCLHEL